MSRVNANANNGIYTTGATLTVNGGEIYGNRSGCRVLYAWNSTVTINNGTFYIKRGESERYSLVMGKMRRKLCGGKKKGRQSFRLCRLKNVNLSFKITLPRSARRCFSPS